MVSLLSSCPSTSRPSFAPTLRNMGLRTPISYLRSSLLLPSMLVGPNCISEMLSPHLFFIATDKYNMKTLKTLYSGAAPLGGPLVTAVRQKLKSVGADVVVGQGLCAYCVLSVGFDISPGYGLTETSPV